MASITRKAHVFSISLEKFFFSPIETIRVAVAKKQTVVTSESGEPKMVIGTNCVSSFDLPEFEEVSDKDVDRAIDRSQWLK